MPSLSLSLKLLVLQQPSRSLRLSAALELMLAPAAGRNSHLQLLELFAQFESALQQSLLRRCPIAVALHQLVPIPPRQVLAQPPVRHLDHQPPWSERDD